MNVLVVFGDQLDRQATALGAISRENDVVLMVEAAGEATREDSHIQRIVFFLSAMRHFADDLRKDGFSIDYRRIGEFVSLEEGIASRIGFHRPTRVHATKPGEYRCVEMLERVTSELAIPLSVHDNRLILCDEACFAEHAEGRKTLRMEYFYRELRRRYDVLMDDGGPCGGSWNYDEENRSAFSAAGPPERIDAKPRTLDATTREVLSDLRNVIPNRPGSIDEFTWPTTPKEAEEDLARFLNDRLRLFGRYQDAMWSGEQFLYHSRLSAALNVGLLEPLKVIRLAEHAYREQRAPLAAVEGFVRQILGWREYVRGIYWRFMPSYREANEMDAHRPLPGFYWSGETPMNCVAQTVRGLQKTAYAHHIQRLMVTGLYAMLSGIKPLEVHDWYMGMYVDSVEWVTLPNVLGMSQFADDGLMASKPYAATGSYVDRMSNYCKECRFNPKRAAGDDACPFTVLYWDYLARHRRRLAGNRRMVLQVRNLDRKSDSELAEIRRAAGRILESDQA